VLTVYLGLDRGQARLVAGGCQKGGASALKSSKEFVGTEEGWFSGMLVNMLGVMRRALMGVWAGIIGKGFIMLAQHHSLALGRACCQEVCGGHG